MTALVALFIIGSAPALPAASKPPTDPTNTPGGVGSLNNNTTGTNNSGFGYQTLFSNTTGSGNTATGSQSLFSNTTGAANTATGVQAMLLSTVGNENTAAGSNALFSNTTGNDNTANGANAAHNNTAGTFNTVNGASALYFNTSGSFNVADGSFALNMSGGNNNIALGYAAGINLTSGDFNIDIGNQGVSGESSTIRIGTQGNHVATYIAGINGATVIGTNVLIDANGQLGTVLSSRRFKDDIKPMDASSEAILSLKPVTFHYKHELDPKGTAQFGLIAEEVEKIDPSLVVHDAEGKVYSVRYDAVNAMLLNEFLKEHRKVEQQQQKITELNAAVASQQKTLQATVARQQDEISKLSAVVKEQASQIQKVQAQMELGDATTRVTTAVK